MTSVGLRRTRFGSAVPFAQFRARDRPAGPEPPAAQPPRHFCDGHGRIGTPPNSASTLYGIGRRHFPRRRDTAEPELLPGVWAVAGGVRRVANCPHSTTTRQVELDRSGGGGYAVPPSERPPCFARPPRHISGGQERGDSAMPERLLMRWLPLLAFTSLAGCCSWCQHHCAAPAVYAQPACCQPCAPACCPAPACAPAPACCPTPAGYPPAAAAPAPAQQWQRSFNPPNCCQ